MESIRSSFVLWSQSIDEGVLIAVSAFLVVALLLVVVMRLRTGPRGAPSVSGKDEAPQAAYPAGPTDSRIGTAEEGGEGIPVAATNEVSVVSPVKQEAPAPSSIASGMSQTRSSFLGRLKSFFSLRPRIDTSCLDDLEELLIASDVGPRCASDLVEAVRAAVKSEVEVTEAVLTDLLKRGVRAHLVDAPATHRLYSGVGAPLVVLVVGVNGVGKTTTVAKLAARYTQSGKKVLVVAADTFRAAAVQQLEEWSRRVGFELVKGAENAKPAAVVFDGMVAAKSGTYDVVLIDTAGRLHTKANLMQELEGVRNSITRHIPDAPHETILVVDGVSGQNALMQARQFHEAVSLTGVVVTKLDGTPKGGVIVPISQELKVPVVYVGVGEKAADLVRFSSEEFIASMFDHSTDATLVSSASAAGGMRQ